MPVAADTPVHASTVAFADRGVIILGASGSGKSALALELLALGGVLVADDRTIVTRRGAALIADCPAAIQGQIEARFVGILTVPFQGAVPLSLAVNLDRIESQRLPPVRHWSYAGVQIPMLHKVAQGYFPAAIRQYLLQG